MKKLCLYIFLLLGALVGTKDAYAQTLTYSQTFTSGASSAPQCGPWITFCNSINLSNTYSSITISGSLGGSATASGAVAQAIATALKNNTAYGPVSDGGYLWAVDTWGACNAGGSGGPELTATGATCQCGNGFTVRPCINNSNWGNASAGGTTCGAPTQTMTVTLNASAPGPPCPWTGPSGFGPGTPPCNSFITGSVGSGTYTFFNIEAGANYTISTCGSSFDTQLSIYVDYGSGWQYQTGNNDNGPDCGGTAASVNWTSSWTTGNAIAVVNRNNCIQHDFTGTSAVLSYRKNCCSPQSATTWNGNVNTDWFTDSNWSNCVPGTITNATIPAGMPRYPAIGAAAYVNTITINNGATVTINAPGTLTPTQ